MPANLACWGTDGDQSPGWRWTIGWAPQIAFTRLVMEHCDNHDECVFWPGCGASVSRRQRRLSSLQPTSTRPSRGLPSHLAVCPRPPPVSRRRALALRMRSPAPCSGGDLTGCHGPLAALPGPDQVLWRIKRPSLLGLRKPWSSAGESSSWPTASSERPSIAFVSRNTRPLRRSAPLYLPQHQPGSAERRESRVVDQATIEPSGSSEKVGVPEAPLMTTPSGVAQRMARLRPSMRTCRPRNRVRYSLP